MKMRPSSLICSKARRASRWATSCERHKFLQPVRRPSQMCGEGFFFCRETCVGSACEFRSHFIFGVYYTDITQYITLLPPPPPPRRPPSPPLPHSPPPLLPTKHTMHSELR